MMHLLRRISSGGRRLPVLACLAALALLAAAVPAVAAAEQSAEPAAASGSLCSVSYLQSSLHLARVTVDSASLNSTGSFTPPGRPPITGLPAFCDVTLTQLASAGNPMDIEAWLPSQWNGRFQGVGGGGYSCGINGNTEGYAEMVPAISGGYATAATDCGHSGSPYDASFALRADGTLNVPLVEDFLFAGIHDMTVDGKAVTQVYYPSALRYSYFNRLGGYARGDREQRWSRCAIIFAGRKRTDRRLCAGLKTGYALSWQTQRRGRSFFILPITRRGSRGRAVCTPYNRGTIVRMTTGTGACLSIPITWSWERVRPALPSSTRWRPGRMLRWPWLTGNPPREAIGCTRIRSFACIRLRRTTGLTRSLSAMTALTRPVRTPGATNGQLAAKSASTLPRRPPGLRGRRGSGCSPATSTWAAEITASRSET